MVHAHAVLAARVVPMALVFEDAHDPEEIVSGQLNAVQARFGDPALDFGPVLRPGWVIRCSVLRLPSLTGSLRQFLQELL